MKRNFKSQVFNIKSLGINEYNLRNVHLVSNLSLPIPLFANACLLAFIQIVTTRGRRRYVLFQLHTHFSLLFVIGEICGLFWSPGWLLQHRLFGPHRHHLCHLQKSECLGDICCLELHVHFVYFLMHKQTKNNTNNII